MAGLSRFVLRHKLVVAVFWLAVLAVGVVASARLSGRLSAQFALPGAASYQADQQILRDYGNGGPGDDWAVNNFWWYASIEHWY